MKKILDATRSSQPPIANVDVSPTKMRNAEPSNKYNFKSKPVKILSAKATSRKFREEENKKEVKLISEKELQLD